MPTLTMTDPKIREAHRLYWDERNYTEDVARHFDITPRALILAFHKLGLKVRPRSGPGSLRRFSNKEKPVTTTHPYVGHEGRCVVCEDAPETHA